MAVPKGVTVTDFCCINKSRLTSVLEYLYASLDKVEAGLVEEGLAGVGGPQGALVDGLLAVHGVQPQLEVLL